MQTTSTAAIVLPDGQESLVISVRNIPVRAINELITLCLSWQTSTTAAVILVSTAGRVQIASTATTAPVQEALWGADVKVIRLMCLLRPDQLID